MGKSRRKPRKQKGRFKRWGGPKSFINTGSVWNKYGGAPDSDKEQLYDNPTQAATDALLKSDPFLDAIFGARELNSGVMSAQREAALISKRQLEEELPVERHIVLVNKPNRWRVKLFFTFGGTFFFEEEDYICKVLRKSRKYLSRDVAYKAFFTNSIIWKEELRLEA